MKLRALIISFLSIAISALAVRADSVWVKGREKPYIGDIRSEDARGVVISTVIDKKKVDELVPALDVIEVHYTDIKPVDLSLAGGEYKVARDADKEAVDSSDPVRRKTFLTTALARYADTHKKMQPHKFAKRHVEYRIAMLTLLQATSESQALDAASARLTEFKSAHQNSWQINHVMPMLAQLQMDVKDYKGAEQTFQEMAGIAELPADVRMNAEIDVVRVNVRAGNLQQAQKKLDALSQKAVGNAKFASRVKMVKAEVLVGQKNVKEAVPLLQQVVKENNDPLIKALAHNTLGEILYKDTKYNEALWEFLWVDAVFNQDRNEQARAKYYLWKTFEQLNKAELAQETQQLLLNDRQFNGTEYQIKALKEAK